MNDRRRVLGRGLGALIPTGLGESERRPADIFLRDRDDARYADVSRETSVPPAAAAESGSMGGDPRDGAPGSEVTDDNHIDVPSRLTGRVEPVPGLEYGEIDINLIRPNPRQPRSVFDDEELAELAHSVAEIGILQPVIVRPANDGVPYELVIGERRWRAAKQAGLQTIPAIVKVTADDDLLRNALLENLHRVQLNPLEEAAAYEQLLQDFSCTHEQLADRLGRSRSQVTNTIRLLKLPAIVARRVAAGVLSAGHARALLRLEDPAAMERLAQRIVAEGLSVRATEEIVTLGVDGGGLKPTRRRPLLGPPPELTALAARLADRLDTKVNISLGRKKGRLTVEFASGPDLDRILHTLGMDWKDEEQKDEPSLNTLTG